MTCREIMAKEYFDYLCDFVVPLIRQEAYKTDNYKGYAWSKCLRLFYNTEYTWQLDMDENRAKDGLALRWRFILDNPVYEQYLDLLDGPCSVLEMLVALALRIEETIMDDPAYGNRTSTWFWKMVVNLGIQGQFDMHFERKRTLDCLTRWMNNDYEPNGKGGLFTLKHCDKDLRDIEIWVQANWYINENYL